MFPLTHLYCTARITSSSDHLLIYGSIFPDVPITGLVNWEKMKNETERFSGYIKKNCPELFNFAEGLLFHEEPNGIDRFVHGENGYAYINGREILDEIKKVFHKDSLDVSHSFIEFAVEFKLSQENPKLQDEMKKILELVNKDINKIAKAFGEHFKLDFNETSEKIKEFNEFLLTMDLSSQAKAIKSYTHLTNKLRKTNASEKDIGYLLEKAIGVIKKNYETFLQEVIIKCKNSLPR